MVKKQQSAALEALRASAQGCRNCPLWENATQTVFGEGKPRAPIMFVGEQPGDQEDREGHPFVGPAGRILDEGLAEAGIDRRQAYVTNVVKHFKWEPRGKRRLHKTPAQREIEACYQWLEGEMAAVKPRLIVALGATAAKALFGSAFRVTKSRGEFMPWPAAAAHPEDFPDTKTRALATIHPSAVLRADNRDIAYGGLVADLKVAAEALAR